MKIVGIICEYNPFHNGHAKQLAAVREAFGEDCAVVCLMSGHFVQRGAPAIFDKMTRAEAALNCGADLVLEMPVTGVLSSAEGFAARGVDILGTFCDYLCFGSETGDEAALMNTARALLSPEFPPLLRQELEKGLSFPAARQQALRNLGYGSRLLSAPNDILGVEYCKAILSSGTAMKPFVIRREGCYHAETPEQENPSATSLRRLMTENQEIDAYIPRETRELFSSATVHTLEAGERAILARLRTMTDEEFESLPYGSEGLWRKLMHECRRCAGLEEILTSVKSKRYTRTRLDRMVMCAFLGISQTDLASPVPYTRVLGFTPRGRRTLRIAKAHLLFHNVGEKTDHPYFRLEQRCADLYGLFAVKGTESAGTERSLRVIFRQDISENK